MSVTNHLAFPPSIRIPLVLHVFVSWHLRWSLAASLPVTIAATSALPTVRRAQAADPAPEIENAKHSFEGVVIDRTFVRSGPSDTFYPTQNIEKGATVIVVAKKGNWSKIQPPEGSFSYIQKAFVNKYGDGKNGKVTTPTLIVRAGNSVQPQLQWAVQTKLDVGQDVTIFGEENEYFKIRPPEVGLPVHQGDEVKPAARAAQVRRTPGRPAVARRPSIRQRRHADARTHAD